MIAMQRRHPFAYRQPIDLVQRKVIALLYRKQMLLKLLQIARIIAQRMRAQITLVFEVLEKLCEVFVHFFPT